MLMCVCVYACLGTCICMCMHVYDRSVFSPEELTVLLTGATDAPIGAGIIGANIKGCLTVLALKRSQVQRKRGRENDSPGEHLQPTNAFYSFPCKAALEVQVILMQGYPFLRNTKHLALSCLNHQATCIYFH